MKKILACLLTLCMVLSMVGVLGMSASAATAEYTMTQVYDGGNYGTSPAWGSVVTISSAEELNMLSAYVSAGKNTSGVTFKLTADITLNADTFAADGTWVEPDGTTAKTGTPVSFTPIGFVDGGAPLSFNGTFDGDGHTISGLYINSDQNDVALFSKVSSIGTVKDMTVKNSYVKGSFNVAAIVASLEYTQNGIPSVLNCTNAGYVVGSSSVAGIVATSTRSVIANCVNSGTVKGDVGVGGILSVAMGAAKVVNCLNTGSITAADSYAAGIVAGAQKGTFENNLNAGTIAISDEDHINTAGAIIAMLIDDTPSLKGNFYLKDSAPFAVAETTEDDSTVALVKTADELKAPAMVAELNLYPLRSDVAQAWTFGNTTPVLSGALPVATVETASGKYVAAGSLADAAKMVGEGKKVTVIRHSAISGGEIGGTYTLDLGNYTTYVSSALTVSTGTVTVTDSGKLGHLNAQNCSAFKLQGGNLRIEKGSFTSTSTYAVSNEGTGILSIYGTPYLQGVDGDVFVAYSNTLVGNNGAAEPTAYTGGSILVACGFEISETTVIAKSFNENIIKVKDFNASKYVLQYSENGDVGAAKIAYGSWGVFGAMLALAALLFVITAVRTSSFKKRMKNYVIIPFLPALGYFTEKQLIALAAGAAVLLIALITMIAKGVSQKKKESAAKAAKAAKGQKKATPVAEKPVKEEAVVEEPVAEETVAEEAVVEEPVAEETVTEEAVVEEPVAEETVAEEAVVEEPVAEETVTEEAVVEEPVVEEADVEESADAANDAEEADVEEETPVTPEAAPAVASPKSDDGTDRLVIAQTDANGNVIYSTYKKSFTARMIQAPADVQERYETLKNALLSYKKVNARTSWSYESFKCGREQLAKFAIRGKTLCLFLALDPEKLEDSKYNVADAGSAKKYATVPCRLRLTSKRSVKWGLELIEMLAEKEQLVKNPKFKAQKYLKEYASTEELIEQNLIKKIH